MTNPYGVTINKGCHSCRFNLGTKDAPGPERKAKTCICSHYDCEVARAGKEHCQYYSIKDWLWNFNPHHSNGWVKPKEFFDWLHGLPASEYNSLMTATKLDTYTGEMVPKYSSMWKAWLDTAEGKEYAKEHPGRR